MRTSLRVTHVPERESYAFSLPQLSRRIPVAAGMESSDRRKLQRLLFTAYPLVIKAMHVL